jgi:hypothetical protein|nr:MAG TPA: hypothetical protein [Bacteriophage sp.]
MAYGIRKPFEMVERAFDFVSSISADIENHWRKSGTTELISFLSVILSGNEELSSTDLRGKLEGRAVVR